MKNNISTKNFNVVGSSNGIIVSFNIVDIDYFPKSISIKGNNLSLKFEYKDKVTKKISLMVINIPCERAIYLSGRNKSVNFIYCVFLLVKSKGRSKSKYFKLMKPA